MAFDREAVFVGSFNLDPRSAVINTEAGLYIESPELAKQLTAYMATGVVPANSYRVLLDPDGMIIWETVRDGQTVRYRDGPGTGFRRRFVADLLKRLSGCGTAAIFHARGGQYGTARCRLARGNARCRVPAARLAGQRGVTTPPAVGGADGGRPRLPARRDVTRGA
jgi:hypothetical protein